MHRKETQVGGPGVWLMRVCSRAEQAGEWVGRRAGWLVEHQLLRSGTREQLPVMQGRNKVPGLELQQQTPARPPARPHPGRGR